MTSTNDDVTVVVVVVVVVEGKVRRRVFLMTVTAFVRPRLATVATAGRLTTTKVLRRTKYLRPIQASGGAAACVFCPLEK